MNAHIRDNLAYLHGDGGSTRIGSGLTIDDGGSGNLSIGNVTGGLASIDHGIIIDKGTAPTSNPTGNGFGIFVDPADNKLKARGGSGTVTVLAVP